jgi:hypothetical protein
MQTSEKKVPRTLEIELQRATDLSLPFAAQYLVAAAFIPVAGLYDVYIANLSFNTIPIRFLMFVVMFVHRLFGTNAGQIEPIYCGQLG